MQDLIISTVKESHYYSWYITHPPRTGRLPFLHLILQRGKTKSTALIRKESTPKYFVINYIHINSNPVNSSSELVCITAWEIIVSELTYNRATCSGVFCFIWRNGFGKNDRIRIHRKLTRSDFKPGTQSSTIFIYILWLNWVFKVFFISASCNNIPQTGSHSYRNSCITEITKDLQYSTVYQQQHLTKNCKLLI